MKRVFDIKGFLKGKMHVLLTLFIVFLLSACGDDASECGTIQQNMGDMGGCAICNLFAILRDSATKMADASWNSFAVDLSKVVVVVAAIYVAYYTLKMVGSFGKQNVADFLTGNKNGLFIFLFKAAIIYYLLSQGISHILQYLISPVFSMAVEIAGQISADSPLDTSVVPKGEKASWASLFGKLYSVSESFNDSISVIISIGQAMSCIATVGNVFKWEYLLLFNGIIVFILGWMLFFGIAFYLADIMIRMLFAAVLLPLGIACAISKLSITYTKNIWNLFLNVFFNLIILGILLKITSELVLLCLGKSFTGSGEATTADFAGAHTADLINAINANDVSTVGSIMQNLGYFVLTVVCFLVLFNLIREMGHLAESISDTAGFSPASQAVAPFAQSTINAANRANAWGRNVVGGAIQQGAHDVSRASRLDKLYKWSGDKASHLRGVLTGTGRQGYKAFWRK